MRNLDIDQPEMTKLQVAIVLLITLSRLSLYCILPNETTVKDRVHLAIVVLLLLALDIGFSEAGEWKGYSVL